MIKLNPLLSISEEIRAWRDSNRNIAQSKKDELKKAVEALSKALLETKMYIKNGLDQRITAKETELINYWNQAHIELKSFNPDLAARCFAKAEYWVDMESWDDEKVKKYNITLDSLRDSLNELA